MTIPARPPFLIWVGPRALVSKLDASTWLDTTHELRQMGWNVALITAGLPDGIQTIRGVKVFSISIPKIYFLRYIIYHWRIWGLLRKWDAPDVILFNSASTPWILPLRLIRILRNSKRPLLVMDTRSLHMPLQSKQGWKGYLRDKYKQFMNALSVHLADGQTTITDLMAKSLRIPSEKMWGVWPSGVNVKRFESCIVQRQWPTGVEPIKLGYIGALEFERNLMGLAIAVEKANAEGMSFQFMLVGEGTQRRSLESYAQNSSGNIIVTPSIPYDDVPTFLSQIHVGVLPFPDEEKFRVSSPIKLFEYMAAGLPILATRIPCHTDVVKNGQFVFWAERADVDGLMVALRTLWQQRSNLKKLSADALLEAQAWTWHESAYKLKSALEGGMKRYASSASDNVKESRGQTRF